MGAAWRYAALGGALIGLAAAPPLEPGLPPWPFGPAATLTLIAAPAAALARARPAAARPRIRSWPWLAAVAALAAASGLAGGVERVRAIDGGAFAGELGSRVEVRGFVAGVPRPADGIVVVPVATADGLLAIEAPLPERELEIGMQVRARGTVREPEPWRAGRLAIAGIKRLVAARRVDSTGATRGGVAGLVDGVRERSEAALERAMPPAEAALARGFVLGQDDRIDDATTRDFRRSGLAHLLAVSGQNVLLLALLAIPILALLGLSLRARLLVVIALIALYVPVTGAGPSIQRAAVMGAVGIVALLAGRPSRRWYAVLLAAALTLAVNPRAGADVGWQLSFAAVVGIVLWSRPVSSLVLRALSRPWRRPDAPRSAASSGDPLTGPEGAVGPPSALDLRRGLAEGAAMTITATLATAPLSAFHFELVPIASLPANLLVLPAVAPIMWLGMLSAALGQLPWIPVEPLNWLCALLVAYVAQVAAWFGDPAWATLELPTPPIVLLAALGVACFLAALLIAAAGRRRSRLSVAPDRIRAPRAAIAPLAAVLAVLALLTAGQRAGASDPGLPTDPPRLTVTVLDVGQGDSIILDPEPGGAVLVDAGPPGTDLGGALDRRGIEELTAAIVTHDQSDHSGGLPGLLGEVPVEAVLHAGAGRPLRAAARAAVARLVRIGRGDSFSVGRLRVEVLWPPAAEPLRSEGSDDPNLRSVVLLARWRRFDALLTGDAEAEAVALRPGPVDLLKIAHHGSEDSGLPALLARSGPRLAVISVGEGNRHGHPHPATLAALGDAAVPTLRTDQAGDVEIVVDAHEMRAGG